MKDARGHGSNSHGGGPVVRNWSSVRGIMPTKPYRQGGTWRTDKLGLTYRVDDAAAAGALASGPKSEPVPVHYAMHEAAGKQFGQRIASDDRHPVEQYHRNPL